MIRRPPRSTRTDTLFPYTTLFRSLSPILITLAIIAFLTSWSDFLWPLIILNDADKQTLPVAAYPFMKRITWRSEEHTSELQSLMRISYAVFCLKKKTTHTTPQMIL